MIYDGYEFKTEPFAHQLAEFAAHRLTPHHGLGFEMGTGKSKSLLDKVGFLFERGLIDGVLIVAPKGCYSDWAEIDPRNPGHIIQHLPDRIKRCVVEWRPDPTQALQAKIRELWSPMPGVLKILVMNVEGFQCALKKPSLAFKVATAFIKKNNKMFFTLDESTSVGNPKALRTKAVIKLASLCPYSTIMTGDAAPDSPLTLWSQGEVLKPQALGYSNFVTFRSAYSHETLMYGPGGRQFKGIDKTQGEQGFRNMEDLRDRWGKIVTVVRSEDCLDLPPATWTQRMFDLSPDQRKVYNTMRDESVAFLEGVVGSEALHDEIATHVRLCGQCGATYNAGEPCSECGAPDLGPDMRPENVTLANLALVKALRLHQIACGFVRDASGALRRWPTNPRVDCLMQVLEEVSGKVVIWSTYRQAIDEVETALAAKYGREAVCTYHGDTTPDARQEAKRRFQDPRDPLNFFIGQTSVGQFGLQLTRGHTAIYFTDGWRREIRRQSEKRVHRIGQTENVLYLDLIARDTVDEDFLPVRLGKQKISDLIAESNWRGLFKK